MQRRRKLITLSRANATASSLVLSHRARTSWFGYFLCCRLTCLQVTLDLCSFRDVCSATSPNCSVLKATNSFSAWTKHYAILLGKDKTGKWALLSNVGCFLTSPAAVVSTGSCGSSVYHSEQAAVVSTGRCGCSVYHSEQAAVVSTGSCGCSVYHSEQAAVVSTGRCGCSVYHSEQAAVVSTGSCGSSVYHSEQAAVVSTGSCGSSVYHSEQAAVVSTGRCG